MTSRGPTGGLSARQRQFCEAYLVDRNATQAAIRAGYAPRSAAVQGSRLLTNDKVKAFLDARLDKISEATDIKAAEVLREFGRIGFSDIRRVMKWTGSRAEFIPSDELDEHTARSIQSVKARQRTLYRDGEPHEDILELEVKLYPKDPALQALARHLNLFKEEAEGASKGLAQLLTLMRNPDMIED